MGFPHPDYLDRTLTPRQLVEWQAFEQLEPFGELGAWLRNAMNCVATLSPYRKRGAPGLDVADFMPRLEEKKVQSPEDMKRILLAAIKGAGKK